MSATSDPALDLVLERTADVSAAFVWRAWTEPELLKRWFTPRPWTTPDCTVDLRPGGAFRTVMRGPDGTQFENTGCYLELVHERRLVWTNVLLPGYRPKAKPMAPSDELLFTATIEIEPLGDDRCRYRATVQHGQPEARERHAAMGFETGWGTAFEQLVALAAER